MMYQLKKIAWGLRALILSPFFGRLEMPSYLGPTMLVIRPKNIFIDRRARIFPGLRAESHLGGKIRIEQDVSIGQDFHITAMGDLRIGQGTLISGAVTVTDIDHEYRDVRRPVHQQQFIHGRTEIGKNCFIGMGARIQAGTILGDGCVVGANSVVRGEFPAHSVIVGVPGRVVKRYVSETESWERF